MSGSACGKCGWLHGAEDECPIGEIGFAPGFKPSTGEIKRDPKAWAAYMRWWRRQDKEKKAAAAAAFVERDEDDQIH